MQRQRRGKARGLSALAGIALAVSCLAVTSDARGAVVLSNLDTPTPGTGGFTTTGWVASTFKTGNLVSSLNSVTFVLAGQQFPFHVNASVYTDAAGKPGAVVEHFAGHPTISTIFTGNPTTSPFQQVTIPSSGVTLSPLTTYWLVMASQDNSGVWALRGPGTVTTLQGWTFPDNMAVSFNSGSSWSVSGGTHKFSIDATPEPATLLLLACGVMLAGRVRGEERRKQDWFHCCVAPSPRSRGGDAKNDALTPWNHY